jgi:hypothetical protein
VNRESFGNYTITYKDLSNVYVTQEIQEDLYIYFHFNQGSWNKRVPRELDIYIGQMIAKQYLAEVG